jgi:alginate O-acetyltransferase complex protein AlgI
MLFHSWLFVAFFAVVYPVYVFARGTRFSKYWLVAASYCFYGVWNPAYLLLIGYATGVDFAAVVCMDHTRRRGWRRLWLILSIINSLSVLCFFKYAGFLVANVNVLLACGGLGVLLACGGLGGLLACGGLGVLLACGGLGEGVIPDPAAVSLPLLGKILLPVGISFFTFQSMSYAIDFYRGHVHRERNFIRYAAFVSLFPQLVAGPIERASHLLPQLHGRQPITREDLADGASLFLVGLFKKVALADYLGTYVHQVYSNPDQYQSLALILATLAFGWQIYFDFSGYTDMARGVGRMMGFRFMLNFRNPYLADGLGDFWRRWHISLSTWFRDYVYIPLGGSRRGRFRTYVNVCITMLVCGFWHGAAWTFVIWGALHALGRVGTRELERHEGYRTGFPRWAKQLWVYVFVNFAWIFFRARNLDDAWLIITKIFTTPLADPRMPVQMLLLMAAVWAYQFLCESKVRTAMAWAPLRVGMAVGMVAYMLLFPTAGEPFIYFQF